MAPPISFKQAAQGAAVAATWAYVSPSSFVSGMGAAAASAVAYYGIEAISRINEGRLKAKHTRLHQIAQLPRPDFDNLVIDRAITRICRDHTEAFHDYCRHHKLKDRNELIEHLKKEFTEGLCYGRTATYLQMLKLGNQSSLNKQLVQEAFFESIYHKQFLGLIHSHLIASIKNIDLTVDIKQDEERLYGDKEFDAGKYKEERLSSYRSMIQQIEDAVFLFKFTSSRKFSAVHSEESYKRIFERAISALPNQKEVIGFIQMPKHVISIQYSARQGYFFADSAQDPGVFKYPTPELLFKHLRRTVIEILKDSKMDPEKQTMHFSVDSL